MILISKSSTCIGNFPPLFKTSFKNRVLFISLLLSFKFLSENVDKKPRYSRVGGIPEKDLIAMENRYLEIIDYKLYLNQEDFNKISNKTIMKA